MEGIENSVLKQTGLFLSESYKISTDMFTGAAGLSSQAGKPPTDLDKWLFLVLAGLPGEETCRISSLSVVVAPGDQDM